VGALDSITTAPGRRDNGGRGCSPGERFRVTRNVSPNSEASNGQRGVPERSREWKDEKKKDDERKWSYRVSPSEEGGQ